MKTYVLGIAALFLALSCKEGPKDNNQINREDLNKPDIEVETYQKLKNFASGSGMAFYNNHFYIVGDDDPYLAKLNEDGDILQRFQLWDTIDVQNGRINKKVKPDFESISLFPYEQDTLMLIFGSGSKSPRRDVILSFKPKEEKLDTLNGKDFFSWLKKTAGLTDKEINLEGSAFHKGSLFLLNRDNNELYKLAESGIKSFIENGSTDDFSLEVFKFNLPEYKNETARFSGASILGNENKILFSATIETTDNWKDDGKILGSFMGEIDLDDLNNQTPLCHPVFTDDNTRFKGKIEALHGIIKNETLGIYFITDDDDGTTGWGKVEL